MGPAKKTADAPPARAGRRRGPTKGDLKEGAILDCAWELLGRKPASEITIEELARGAGISRSTFYFYFASRDAVVRALADRVGQHLHDTFGAPLVSGSGDDPRAVVRAAVAGYMERWRTEGHVLRAMAPLAEVDEEMRAFWQAIGDRMVDTIAAAIEAEREVGRALPAPPSAPDLARVLVAMLWRSGFELSSDRPTAAEQRRRVDTLTAVCLRAVYGSDLDQPPPADAPP